MTSSLNIKSFPDCVVNIRGETLCFVYIALPLLAIARMISIFDNFETLSMLFGFSRDIQYTGRVGEGLLRTRISNFMTRN